MHFTCSSPSMPCALPALSLRPHTVPKSDPLLSPTGFCSLLRVLTSRIKNPSNLNWQMCPLASSQEPKDGVAGPGKAGLNICGCDRARGARHSLLAAMRNMAKKGTEEWEAHSQQSSYFTAHPSPWCFLTFSSELFRKSVVCKSFSAPC